MNEKKLPCPFCGSQPIRVVDKQILSIYCPKCVSIGFHNHVNLGCIADQQWKERFEKKEVEK